MADSELDILIRLLADTKGADAVQSALNKTKEVTSDTSKASGELTEQTKEGTKEAEKFELGHRAIHKILHLIAHETSPAFGAALAGATALGTSSTMLLIMAVKELLEWLHKAREAADEMRKESADVQVAMWDAQREAMAEAAKAANDYHDALTKISSVAGSIKQADDARLAVINAQVAAAAKLLEFQEKQALLAAKGNAVEEERIRKLFEGKKETAELGGEVAKIVELRKNEETLLTNAAAAKRRYDDAHASTTAASSNSEEAQKAQAEIDVLKSKTKDGQKDLLNKLFEETGETEEAAARERVEKMRKYMEEASDFQSGEGPSPKELAARQYVAAKKALDEVNAIESKIDGLNKTVIEHNTALENLKKAEERAKQEMDKLRDQAEATKQQIETAEAIYKVKAGEAKDEGKSAPGIPAIGAKTGQGLPPIEEVWKNFQRNEDVMYHILDSGGKLDSTQTALLHQILQMQTGHRVLASQFLAVLRTIYTDQDALKKAMDRELKSLQHARDQAGY